MFGIASVCIREIELIPSGASWTGRYCFGYLRDPIRGSFRLRILAEGVPKLPNHWRAVPEHPEWLPMDRRRPRRHPEQHNTFGVQILKNVKFGCRSFFVPEWPGRSPDMSRKSAEGSPNAPKTCRTVPKLQISPSGTHWRPSGHGILAHDQVCSI